MLFVDEIHRLSPAVEEVLYPAMEDFQIDIMIGEGPAARSIKLDLPPFTLIGATTRAGLLTAPLRDRFGIVQRLEFYTPEELTRIVRRSASILGIACDADGAGEIARRSRGTPRIANRLLRRVRDFAQVRAAGHIDREVANAAMQMLKVDPEGFDELDRRMLRIIIDYFDGGPVGVESLAAALSEERGTLEDVIEPYLIQQGYLVRTARGRMATREGLSASRPASRRPGSTTCSIDSRPKMQVAAEPVFSWPTTGVLGRYRRRRRGLSRAVPGVPRARAHRMAARARQGAGTDARPSTTWSSRCARCGSSSGSRRGWTTRSTSPSHCGNAGGRAW